MSAKVVEYCDDELIEKYGCETYRTRKNISNLSVMDKYMFKNIFPSMESYDFIGWDIGKDDTFSLKSYLTNPDWNDFFGYISKKKYYKNMESAIDSSLKNNKILVPYPNFILAAFNILSPKDISVVIVGQDPYPGSEDDIPYASGLSFSVPTGMKQPASLKNIQANLKKFGHVRPDYTCDCLGGWALQGCFLVNSALTTISGEKKSHSNIWKLFTQDLIFYLNKYTESVAFMVFGSDAHRICQPINPKKHYITTSSHPSPLSAHSTVRGSSYGYSSNKTNDVTIIYPPFESTDHFGKVNIYLKSVNKPAIIWDAI